MQITMAMTHLYQTQMSIAYVYVNIVFYQFFVSCGNNIHN